MPKLPNLLRKFAVILFAVLIGMAIGRARQLQPVVHAQVIDNTVTPCVAVVPQTWGEYKGGSAYGLAFQDHEGVLRFVPHPPCGGSLTREKPIPAIAELEIQRN